jgi:hypothetical protein
LGLAILMTGCTVRSLYPLFEEKDVYFDPSLLGTWGEEGSSESWTFVKSGDNAYVLTDKEGDKLTNFDAHLVRLGNLRFLDLYPQGIDDSFAIPAHLFLRVCVDGDTLRAALFNPDWLKDAVTRGVTDIAHLRLRDSIVLTASPKELQRLVVQCAFDEEAFPVAEFYRQKGSN